MKKIGMVVALEKELKAFLEKQTVEIKEENMREVGRGRNIRGGGNAISHNRL